MGDGMGQGMGLGWVFGPLVVIGVVVLACVLVRSFGGGNVPPPKGPGAGRAREILEERYARGEISTEAFRVRLRTLEEGDR